MADREDKEFGELRREYKLNRLDESQLPDDPLQLFATWMDTASSSGIIDPTAMTLSTVNDKGAPSSRIVLLKKIEPKRLIFFTNFQSKKAREIRNNPKVAAHFYWPGLERQLKISGVAQEIEHRDSDLYFSSRPIESKVAAWASPQSEEVPDRKYLEREYRKYLEKFKGSKEIPRPDYWGGFAIRPDHMEFWQGGKYRLHDRISYSVNDEGWSRIRLAP